MSAKHTSVLSSVADPLDLGGKKDPKGGRAGRNTDRVSLVV